ncbi:hypothetical protein DFH29DRAFT_299947 [Suillus ampliporus]|nr:hypothetical protein DFH29DRAFT_299947 [Suillus ampliporus]
MHFVIGSTAAGLLDCITVLIITTHVDKLAAQPTVCLLLCSACPGQGHQNGAVLEGNPFLCSFYPKSKCIAEIRLRFQTELALMDLIANAQNLDRQTVPHGEFEVQELQIYD